MGEQGTEAGRQPGGERGKIGKRGERGGATYTTPAQHNQTKPINHPCVVSPRRLPQPNTRSRLKRDPETRVVKSIRSSAAA